ncbi:Met18p [Sporobolomyces salmoneus]|uniref:Met18p n=1 Tax=Sporobolomyces salmoneus TaxID=183962 RepID=UPI00317B2037
MSIPSKLVPLLRGYTALDDTQLPDSTVPSEIAQGLESKEWKLIDIVKGLQDNLTSENDKVRSRGVGLLSRTVEEMDKSLLDRQSTQVLTTFFTTKLSDYHSLVSCASALIKLTQAPNFGTGEGIQVTRGIFSSVTLKNHAQSTRYKLYLLLDSLMHHSRPALKRLGKEFLKGYCSLVEGEKDPRNLMISFGLIRVMVLEFELDGCVEELFDISFCYFPITFTPPKDDPYGITSQDLIEALRACLSATPLFGPLALPLFLDKLQAASEKAKRQTLEALIACFPIYGARLCGDWALKFSEALSLEVFHATEERIQRLALEAFHSLFRTLYPDRVSDSEGGDTEMKESEGNGEKGIVEQVVGNSLQELEEPEKRDSKAAMRILITLAACSHRLTRYVLNETLPPLLELAQNPEEVASRPSILSHLSILISSFSSSANDPSEGGLPSSLLHSTSSSSSLDFSQTPLENHKDTLLSLFTSSTKGTTATNRLPALKGLIGLVRIPNRFLDGKEIEFIVSTFNDLVIPSSSSTGSTTKMMGEETVEDEVYDLALENLIIVSELHPKIIESTTLPLLFSQLPITTPSASRGYTKILSALAALSLPADLFEFFSLRILSRLEELLSSSSSTSTTGDSLYAHHLLVTLKSVIEAKIRKKVDEDLKKYLENGFIKNLLGFFILPTLPASNSNAMDMEEAGQEKKVTTATDLRLLVDVGKILGLVLTRVEVESQTTFYQSIDEAFQTGNLAGLLGTNAVPKDLSSSSFAPFSSSSPISQQNLLTLYTSSLLSLRPIVPLSSSHLLSLLNLLLTKSLQVKNELQLQAVCYGLASLVNKRVGSTGGTVEGWLEGVEMREYWERNLGTTNRERGEVGRRRKALRVWTWIAKALIVRSDPRGYKMVESLLGLFSDPELGRDAAKGLGVIADEEKEKVLTKENFSVIRLLYKQRFFTFLLPKLVDAHEQQRQQQQQSDSPSTTTTTDQAVYLIALSSLLQHIPKQLTLTELPKLLPLLITSLELPDPILRANVIDTLGILVLEIPQLLEPNISSIVSKTIRSAIPSASDPDSRAPGSIKLRIASLEFLALLPNHIPYLTLHPQKTMVLKELGKAIDDPRKEVRRVAVECRSAWFGYN